MDQRDYAESWAWVYFMLHSPPERRELLTGYLADCTPSGAASRFRCDWRRCNAEPERPLTEYLATLKKSTSVR